MESAISHKRTHACATDNLSVAWCKDSKEFIPVSEPAWKAQRDGLRITRCRYGTYSVDRTISDALQRQRQNCGMTHAAISLAKHPWSTGKNQQSTNFFFHPITFLLWPDHTAHRTTHCCRAECDLQNWSRLPFCLASSTNKSSTVCRICKVVARVVSLYNSKTKRVPLMLLDWQSVTTNLKLVIAVKNQMRIWQRLT